jgi:hypothetical protein
MLPGYSSLRVPETVFTGPLRAEGRHEAGPPCQSY